jgi:hypothetical protein
MNAQPLDVQAILTRIAKLEQQNRKLKRVATAGLLVLATLALTGALSARGQKQQENQRPSDSHHYTKDDLAQTWRLADGRLVVFPPSVKKVEEVDATAVDLPPGTRVIGWEPVEGASSLLPGYEQRVSSIPTTNAKLDSLANAAGILQSQVNDLQVQVTSNLNYVSEKFLRHAKVLDDHAALIDQATVIAADADNRSRTLDAQDLKNKMEEFEDAACPLLRTARMNETTRTKLDSACGLE